MLADLRPTHATKTTAAASREAAAPPRRETAREAVTRTLQSYADRGVFRGFHVDAPRQTPRRAAGSDRDRHTSYRFSWLMRPPMRVTFDEPRNVIAFKRLFPALTLRDDIGRALAARVRERQERGMPAHLRIDGRRARVTLTGRRGALTLAVHVRGAQHEYAVRSALNLVNALFLLLQETFPDYLIEHFGMSAE